MIKIIKAEDIISKMTQISSMKYIENPNFSDERKDWAFFVSKSVLMTLKRACDEHLTIRSRIYDIKILGYNIFGVDDLDDDIIYFARRGKL